MRHLYILLFVLHCTFSIAQAGKAPARKAGEGGGPYNCLIIRGVTLINSTGAPPMGPVEIVVEKNRGAQVRQVGFPGVAIDPKGRPQAGAGDQEN